MAGVVSLLKRELGVIMNGLRVELKDLEGLPDELLKQLNVTFGKSKCEESRYLHCAENLGGEFFVDSLMIEYWRQYKTILDKAKTIAKIYRMIKKGLLFAHPTEKGVYSVLGYDI